jgi:hypothetical protein
MLVMVLYLSEILNKGGEKKESKESYGRGKQRTMNLQERFPDNWSMISGTQLEAGRV